MTGTLPSAHRIRCTVGRHTFAGQMEPGRSPRSAQFLADLMPLQRSVIHARWSGEAGWAPLKVDVQLPAENAIAHPQPGQILLYAGQLSEPELLIPYGPCAFACRDGALAGNHVITLENIDASLRELGTTLLWKGAQELRLEWER